MSLVNLQKQIQQLTDEINDIFHASQLNFDAIKIHLQIEDQSTKPNQKPTQNQPSQIKHTITQCEKQFQALKNAYKQRTNIRLEYLINQQIKSEEQKVRRQRLLEYEDKIYDHRRLICDKESFYDTLVKPKIKRPPGMVNQQFQEFKMKQAQNEERENFKQLEEQTQILLKLEKFLRTYRLSLEEQFDKYQEFAKEQSKNGEPHQINEQKPHQKGELGDKEPQLSEKQIKSATIKQKSLTKQKQKEKVLTLLNSTPSLYSKFENFQMIRMTPQAFEQSRKLLQQCLGLSSNEEQLQKQFKEEREMYKYLKWEQTDLVKKYKKLHDQINELRSIKKVQKKRKPSF